MISITIKLKKEDKPIFAKVVKKRIQSIKVENYQRAAEKELLQQIYSKLMSSWNTDSVIRLSLIQLVAFEVVLTAYRQLGAYENANFIELSELIKTQINKKIQVLQTPN